MGAHGEALLDQLPGSIPVQEQLVVAGLALWLEHLEQVSDCFFQTSPIEYLQLFGHPEKRAPTRRVSGGKYPSPPGHGRPAAAGEPPRDQFPPWLNLSGGKTGDEEEGRGQAKFLEQRHREIQIILVSVVECQRHRSGWQEIAGAERLEGMSERDDGGEPPEVPQLVRKASDARTRA